MTERRTSTPLARRPPPVDDPTGGRGLTRRLAVVLPIALVVGLAIGVPIAVVVGAWQPGLWIPLAVVAVAGTITAAIEDGRVQRRLSGRLGR
jgi:hypothetical protein